MRKVVLAVCALLAATPPAWAGDYWRGVAAETKAAVNAAERAFAANDQTAALAAVTTAYFGKFEGLKMEAAIRKEIGAKRAFQVEKLFGEMRKAIKAADAAAVASIANDLGGALAEDAAKLDAAAISPDVYEANK
ncbi:MAG: hypothetical protein HQL40_17075 [Alphaproteobacteria bacterium]|nr:hypothetical protein [Alphaproteobacteria bacterium]